LIGRPLFRPPSPPSGWWAGVGLLFQWVGGHPGGGVEKVREIKADAAT